MDLFYHERMKAERMIIPEMSRYDFSKNFEKQAAYLSGLPTLDDYIKRLTSYSKIFDVLKEKFDYAVMMAGKTDEEKYYKMIEKIPDKMSEIHEKKSYLLRTIFSNN